jgi:glycerol-3-phosphate dehydrogenase
MTTSGWWDVTGGKLTTYRLMAEETVDAIVKHSGRKVPQCRTADVPLLELSGATAMSGILPPPVSAAAVKHYCQNEWAVHLDDVMIRRASWRHYHLDQLEVAGKVATWMADELGWDCAQVNRELIRYRDLIGEVAAVQPHVAIGGNGYAAVSVGSAAPRYGPAERAQEIQVKRLSTEFR